MKAARAESGMDRNTATVARMLPEEHQDHQPGEHQADGALMHQGLDGRAHKHRLVKHDLVSPAAWARPAGWPRPS